MNVITPPLNGITATASTTTSTVALPPIESGGSQYPMRVRIAASAPVAIRIYGDATSNSMLISPGDAAMVNSYGCNFVSIQALSGTARVNIQAIPDAFWTSSTVVALFSPANNFSSGQQGAWYDPSDYATLFQDSAGTTPVTGVAQPVGRVLDKSGRSNIFSQATASARPLTNTQAVTKYLTFDGIDDGLSTGPMTFTADMDCFIAVRRNSAANVVLAAPTTAGGSFFGVIVSADASSADGGSGTPTYAANGVSLNSGLTGTTRAQLHTALPVASWVVLEVKNLNLFTPSWNAFAIGNYAGFLLNGDIGGIILCPAGDATARQKNRQYLGAKVGLTLP